MQFNFKLVFWKTEVITIYINVYNTLVEYNGGKDETLLEYFLKVNLIK